MVPALQGPIYRASDWFWLVAARPGEVYASARAAFVPLTDEQFAAFLAAGGVATPIPSEALLRAELNEREVGYLGEPLPPLEVVRPRVHRARARLSRLGFTLASGTGAAVQWGAGGFDPLNMNAAAGPNPDRITIPAGQGGVFLVSAAASFAASATGDRALQIRRNAQPVPGGTLRQRAPGSLSAELVVTRTVSLQGGDILRVAAAQDSGGDLQVDAWVDLGRIE